ncbi:NACHT domain-containing protein [Nocardioides sp. NPDC057577]|uniref:NACHT domain-containing protein n=1 Tax=Nocardioides sp. NPDC057577 TaxID=3346171 RepID=UPI0036702997
MTGVEAALAKAAAGSVQKALGWVGKPLIERIRERKLVDALSEQWSGADSASLPALSAKNASAFSQLLESAELEHFSLQLVLNHYLVRTGEKRFATADLHSQLESLLRLHVTADEEVLQPLERYLFSALEGAALTGLDSALELAGGVPKRTQLAIAKCSANFALSATRNSELMSSMTTIGAIHEFEKSLAAQIASVHGMMRLPHANSSRSVKYESLFVQPRIRLGIGDDGLDISELSEVLRHSNRTVLLGDPGGGKSTSSLKLTYDIAKHGADGLKVRIPFFVQLRDYAKEYSDERTSLVSYIEKICETPYSVKPPGGGVEYLLLNGIAVVVFDGLDELLETSQRRDVVTAVEGFAHRYPSTQILVTSRKVGYEEAPLDDTLFTIALLSDFEDEEVESYARKWFSLDESIERIRRSELADAFLGDSEYVSDLRSNPLMLALMCGLYSGERYIPKNRPDLYEKCAVLLFERWDKQRGIVAPLPFDAHVMASLRSLALWLYSTHEQSSGLPREKLVEFMTSYLLKKRFEDLEEAENAANSFIDFCRGRAWVLTDVGAERYWFTHQTFLEFFAAAQLVRENASAQSLYAVLLDRIEAAEWDVVAQLAVQALGKTVEDGADDLLELLITRAADLLAADEQSRRVNILSFAARALAFVVPRPAVVRGIVNGCVALGVTGSVDDRRQPYVPLLELMGANPENQPLIRACITSELRVASSSDRRERALALVMFWGALSRSAVGRSARSARFDAEIEQVAEEMALECQPEIAAASNEVPWIAARHIFSGEWKVQDVVGRFGVPALYECFYGDVVIAPPPAYSLVRHAGRQGYRGGLGSSEEAAASEVLNEIHDALIAAPGPWFEGDFQIFQSMFDVDADLDQRPLRRDRDVKTDVVARSVAILLLLPLIEIWILIDRGHTASRPHARIHLLSERVLDRSIRRDLSRGDRGPRPDPRSVIDSLRLTTSVRRAVDSWLELKLNFVDPRSKVTIVDPERRKVEDYRLARMRDESPVSGE